MLLAHLFLAITTAAEHTKPTPTDLIPLSLNEIRHLCARIVLRRNTCEIGKSNGENMIRKILVGTAIVAGTLAFSAPAMASPWGPRLVGVYPSEAMALDYCKLGIASGDWGHCKMKKTYYGIELWVSA